MDLKKRVEECLQECGISITVEGEFENINSLNFIEAIVSLEEQFDIEFADEYLLPETMSNMQTLLNIVEILIGNKGI